MDLSIIAKAVEVVESATKRLEPIESSSHDEIYNKKNPAIERIGEIQEIPKDLKPDIEVIKMESLQQLIEKNKSKIEEIRNAIEETTEENSSVDVEKNNNESDDSGEEKELSKDEIDEKQKAAIKNALEKIRSGEKLTNEELGNLGEMMMDQYYISKGYKPLNKHRVTSLDDKKGGFKTGIDGVYEKTNPDGTKSYVIADAKYNTSQLSETNDGKQMSDNWIDKRLDGAVGKEKADEIRDVAEDNPNSVSHEVYHINPNVDKNGNIYTDIQKVDSKGNKTGEKIIVEYFDEDGNQIESSYDN